MADKIDYKFLSDREGGAKTNGYIPAANKSKSGVTIGTGFDLGQRSESDLKALGLSTTLINKLKPYTGKKDKDAKDILKKKPLVLNTNQVMEIDKAVKKKHINDIKQKYNAAIKEGDTKFDDLPAEAQTVISSVSFQYGTNLKSAAPKFWKAVTAEDWKKTKEILEDFGDVYPTRRGLEADLIGKIKDEKK